MPNSSAERSPPTSASRVARAAPTGSSRCPPFGRRSASRAARAVLIPGLLLGLGACASPSGRAAGSPETPLAAGDTAAASDILDAFHRAASTADGDAYFDLFAADGVFIGTDAGEHWTVDEFRDYARPYFDRGQGWTYVPLERNVYLSSDGRVAWFDELLDNEGLGLTRGTGVLVREDRAWRVAQYHLTIPVPNEIAGQVVEMIREAAPRQE